MGEFFVTVKIRDKRAFKISLPPLYLPPFSYRNGEIIVLEDFICKVVDESIIMIIRENLLDLSDDNLPEKIKHLLEILESGGSGFKGKELEEYKNLKTMKDHIDFWGLEDFRLEYRYPKSITGIKLTIGKV